MAKKQIESFERILKIPPKKGQAIFLWGPRKTGKSTFLKQAFPHALHYDLLKTDLYFRLKKSPHELREEILSLPDKVLRKPIIIDEVQKIPILLNEIHWLIENTKATFILCGSSARQLKRGSANLLGGRAWRYTFYPLTSQEIPDLDLLRALNHGLIPSHYLANSYQQSLKSYIFDYLKEEIQAEGLTRNLAHFARFLDSVGFSHAGLTNYSNISRDCGIDAKTVKEYYQILIDTLIGTYVYPYRKKATRQTITATPKFYLFDVGVANFLAKRSISTLKGEAAGAAFEHFILMELNAFRGLKSLFEFEISFWRTKTGLEVDFILGNAEVAIEVKINTDINKTDLKGLIAFKNDYPESTCYIVCQAPKQRRITLENGGYITVLPWENFLEKLWKKAILK